MEFDPNPRPSEFSRALVGADPGIDPLGMTLLIPVDDESRPWSESTRAADRLLHDADVLLGAAGIHLEEVVVSDGAGPEVEELVRMGGFDAMLVCARGDTMSVGVLPLAARLARKHGLDVIDSHGGPGHPGWLRRVVGPLFYRQRPSERAA
jgi:hypothetical protein